MADGAVGIGLVLVEELPESFATVFAFGGIEFGNFEGRWGRGIVEDVPECPRASIDNPVITHPCEHGLDSGVTEDAAAAWVVGFDLDGSEV